MPLIAHSPVLRRIRTFVILSLNLLACLCTLVIYWFASTSPADFWPAGFLLLLLPVLMVAHLGFIFYWLWKVPSRAIFSCIVLLTGFSYWQRTFTLHWGSTIA